MGLVVAAEHLELRTNVAIKLLNDKYMRRPDVVERFVREARASALLTSDHVCRVFDVDRLDTGVPYFVMELLHGRDLARVLRAEGPLDVAPAPSVLPAPRSTRPLPRKSSIAISSRAICSSRSAATAAR